MFDPATCGKDKKDIMRYLIQLLVARAQQTAEAPSQELKLAEERARIAEAELLGESEIGHSEKATGCRRRRKPQPKVRSLTQYTHTYLLTIHRIIHLPYLHTYLHTPYVLTNLLTCLPHTTIVHPIVRHGETLELDKVTATR